MRYRWFESISLQQRVCEPSVPGGSVHAETRDRVHRYQRSERALSRLANFPGDVETFELDLLPEGDAADFLLERTAGRRRAADDDEALVRRGRCRAARSRPVRRRRAQARRPVAVTVRCP